MKKPCENCGNFINSYSKKQKYCSRLCYAKLARTNDQAAEKNKLWIQNLITKEELVRLYNGELQSIKGISLIKNCSEGAIRNRLRIFGIKKRGYTAQWEITKEKGRLKLKSRDQNSVKGNRKNYLEIAKASFEWKCRLCGKIETSPNFDLIVHHKDKNNKNNQLTNLEVLCQACHAQTHIKMQYEKILCLVCKNSFVGYKKRKFCSKHCGYVEYYRRKKCNQLK